MQLDAKALAEATAEIVKTHVAAAVAPLLKRIDQLESRPVPERGEKGEAGDRGEPGREGRDGVGVAGALIDRSGVLVLTLSDGTTRELGCVVGKDGVDGRDGNDGVDGKDGVDGAPGVDGLDGAPGEKGADGRDGKDGRDGADGFGFDDMAVEPDGERGFKLVFTKDSRVKEFGFELPVVIDRGVFKADQEQPYQAGDAVTWGGSLWIAQKETSAKPDTPDSGWRLAVKRGRDGKGAKGA